MGEGFYSASEQLSPTLENLCLYFAERLRGDFPGLSRVVVSRPSVGESCSLAL